MVATLIFPFFLSRNQPRYELFDIVSSLFCQPIGDHDQEIRVRLECTIESRGVNEDHRMVISGMCDCNRSNFCRARLPTMANRFSI
jgi:hypothetical protein